MSKDKMAVTQELTNRVPTLEKATPVTKSYERDGVTYTINSLVPYFPLGDKVVIRQTYEESIALIRDEKSIREMEANETVIVATGPSTFGVNIGDKVDVSLVNGVKAINFEGNNKSIKNMHNLLKEVKMNPIELNSRKVFMIEYYIVPLFAINGILDE